MLAQAFDTAWGWLAAVAGRKDAPTLALALLTLLMDQQSMARMQLTLPQRKARVLACCSLLALQEQHGGAPLAAAQLGGVVRMCVDVHANREQLLGPATEVSVSQGILTHTHTNGASHTHARARAHTHSHNARKNTHIIYAHFQLSMNIYIYDYAHAQRSMTSDGKAG